MLVIWKLRARPRRLISNGAAPAISLAVEPDRAARGREAAADQVEQRRFAGAVGADDREPLAARDVERDAADDLGHAETLLDVAQLQRIRGTSWRCGVRRGPVPAPPSTQTPGRAEQQRRPPTSAHRRR